MTVSPGVGEGQVDRQVGGRARVGLHVGVVDPEHGLGALDRQRLDLVDHLLALVVALARVALGVFVRQHRAGGLENGLRDVVFRCDEPTLSAWSCLFGAHERGDFRVGLVEGARW